MSGRKFFNGANGRIFFGKSRAEKNAASNLGTVLLGGIEKKHFRSAQLKMVDKYLHSTQYDGLADWDEGCGAGDNYVKLKQRKPKIIFPFAKIFRERIGGKLVGHSTFPSFKIEDDDEAEYFINNLVIPSSFFKAKMLEIGKDLALRTSAFARFKFADGVLQIIKYNSNYCYPEFDAAGALESVEIKYIYTTDEIDPTTGAAICRWFKLDLGKESDILYDNPIYKENVDPEFVVNEQVDHNLGFVQGEWFRFGEDPHSPDGSEEPIISMMLDFIDAINYNLSLSDQATNYGTEPQLTITGMDQEEADNLIKSATKTWMLGREGKAEFINADGGGVDQAEKQRNSYLKIFQHIARIVLMDPEKFAGAAQSGKAMEILHAPMVELINEMRPWMEKGMTSMLQKITTAIVMYEHQGMETQFEIPKGWVPSSLNLTVSWPPIFELTTQDKQQILSIGIQAASNNLIARDTALEWIQSQGVDFGVEDIEMETQKINSQQQFNTFGF